MGERAEWLRLNFKLLNNTKACQYLNAYTVALCGRLL